MTPILLLLALGCELILGSDDDTGFGGDRDTLEETGADSDSGTPTDSDGDGLTDAEERAGADGIENSGDETDPNRADTDGDGLSDGDEVLTHGTDPNAADSDGGGASDSTEISLDLDPNDPSDDRFAAVLTVNVPDPLIGGEEVTLTAAVDLGSTVTWSWSQTSGETVTVDDLSSNTLRLVLPSDGGQLNFEVTATVDGYELPAHEAQLDVFAGGDTQPNHSGSPFFQFGDLVSRAAIGPDNRAWITRSDATTPVLPGMQSPGPGLQAVDLTNPHQLVAGPFLPLTGAGYVGAWSDIVAVGVSENNVGALVLVDVSSPESPTELATLSHPDIGRAVGPFARSGDVLYAGTENQKILVIDISTPSAPAVEAVLDSPNGVATVWQFAVEGSLLVANWHGASMAESAVQLFDIATPLTPQVLSTMAGTVFEHSVALDGDTLAQCAENELIMWSVATPSSPVVLGSFPDLRCRSLYLSGDDLYLVPMNAGLGNAPSLHLKVTTPSAPSIEAPLSTILYPVYGQHQGRLLSTGSGRLRLIDPALPLDRSATRFSRSDGLEPKQLFAEAGHLITVANGSLVSFDLAVPTAPEELSTLALGGFNPTLAAGHGRLASISSNTLTVYDITDPTNITIGGTDTTSGVGFMPSASIAADAPVLAFGDGSRTTLFDLQDASAPAELAAITSAGSPRMAGSRVAVASGFTFEAFDVSDPTSPLALLDSPYQELGGFATSMSEALPLGDVVLTLGYEGANVYRVVEGEPVEHLRSFALPSRGHAPGALAQQDDMLYFYMGQGGVAAIDLSSPEHAYLALTMETIGARDTLAILDGTAYQAIRGGEVLAQPLPERPALFGAPSSPQVGGTQVTLTATFAPPSPQEIVGVDCTVAEGTCEVSTVDLSAGTATLGWTLPERVGEHRLIFNIGGQDWWVSQHSVATVGAL